MANPLIPIITTGMTMSHNASESDKNYKRQRELMNLQLQNQEYLNHKQMQNQMNLNKQGQQIQMDMFDYTNYPNQVRMMKDAGLNPSLLYGLKGGGGITTGSQSGGAAQGGQAQAGSAPPPNYMDVASLALIGSEIKLKEAQAKQAEASATKTAGIDTELGKAEMLNVYAQTDMLREQIDTENIKQATMELQKEMTEIEKQSKELSLQMDKETYDAKVATINQGLENLKRTNEKIIEETRGSKIQNDNAQKLINQQIQLNNWAMVEAQVRIAAGRKGIEVSDNQIYKMKQEVLQGWANVQTNKDALTTSEKNTKALADATIKSALIVGGLSLTGDIAKLFIPMGVGRSIVGGFMGK